MTTENTAAAVKTTTDVSKKLASMTPLQYSVSIADIETKILEVEGIRVVFRTSPNRRIPGLGYDFKNSLKSGVMVDLTNRIKAVLKPAGDVIEWVVVDGDGRAAFPGTWKLDKIRKTYGKDVAE